MKFEYTLTSNWENAFRGLRHPLESYNRSDSEFGFETPDYVRDKEIIRKDEDLNVIEYAAIGPNDMDLAQRMIKAGSPNDKFLRQIFVSVDITAPLFWWKECDTYKVATVANSTSTMHKLSSTPITKECFEMDDYQNIKVWDSEPYNPDPYTDDVWDEIIDACETLRQRYVETKDERYWKELIRILPESWLQTRTWTSNYATLRQIYKWRKGHRLVEWHQFCEWIGQLPYADELLLFEN